MFPSVVGTISRRFFRRNLMEDWREGRGWEAGIKGGHKGKREVGGRHRGETQRGGRRKKREGKTYVLYLVRAVQFHPYNHTTVQCTCSSPILTHTMWICTSRNFLERTCSVSLCGLMASGSRRSQQDTKGESPRMLGSRQTIPQRLTVAGEATARSCTSNMIVMT